MCFECFFKRIEMLTLRSVVIQIRVHIWKALWSEHIAVALKMKKIRYLVRSGRFKVVGQNFLKTPMA